MDTSVSVCLTELGENIAENKKSQLNWLKVMENMEKFMEKVVETISHERVQKSSNLVILFSGCPAFCMDSLQLYILFLECIKWESWRFNNAKSVVLSLLLLF